MYVFASAKKPSKPVGFPPEEISEDLLVHYWRKHPDLHGWMEQLWRAKGGEGLFNCEPVVLTAEDLDHLEESIRSRRLPHTSGFFFGETDGSERSGDLAFVEKARWFLGQGLTVFYTSWW
ncbi:phosphoglycerate kinase [Methyloraptor flagellatus]|uniref:Phosphoglycerate kinase n=1 Tax=Methyloraptor flagellatus TaxID=3162530 RepID=A0AAU7XG66_9HYPH